MVELKYTRNTKNIWFPDQREPEYDPDDQRKMKIFQDYWKKEKDRLINGFAIADGQVYISGWLYWHTVYWTIATYVEIEKPGARKRKLRVIKTPDFRDIEWETAGDFTKCEDEGLFYNLVGSRDFGKTVLAGSRVGYSYTLFDKSESIISAGQLQYIKVVTEKVEDGLINLHPVFQKQRLLNDWKKEVIAGWKEKKTNVASSNSSQSCIKMRNYEDGNKTMAAVGTRPGFHLIDEIGTLPNLIACVKDSDPAWRSGDGDKPSCLVMLTGTGGDMEVGAEAAEIFYHPEAYDMLSFDDIWEGRGKIGKFMPATKVKMKYKEPKTMSEYLGINHPDLERVTILVANEERALKEWWEPEFEKARKSGNPKTLLKFRAYWPLKPSDSFLILTQNDFNVAAAEAQQARLKGLEKTGMPVTLAHDGEKICHKASDKLPISEFPLKTQSGDAPVVIWEFPVQENPPFGLYTAGVDPYRFGSSEYSDSLGAVYIFKRIHDITGEKYQNLIVASYVARPHNKDTWNETARLLIKYYNAYTLCENDEYSFIDYMIKKGDAARYLAPQPQWLKEIVPHTSVNREYGIHRSSDRVREHLHGIFQRYLDEVIYQEKAENGETKETLGVTRVFDVMLLEEIRKFNYDGNFDRIVAAELAIAMADHLNPQFVVANVDSDPRLKSYFSGKKPSSSIIDFSRAGSIMNRDRVRKSKLFL